MHVFRVSRERTRDRRAAGEDQVSDFGHRGGKETEGAVPAVRPLTSDFARYPNEERECSIPESTGGPGSSLPRSSFVAVRWFGRPVTTIEGRIEAVRDRSSA